MAKAGTSESTRRPPLEQKQFAKLSGDDVAATQLAGEDITAKLTGSPRQPRQDRRPEGHHREQLVRGPSFRHREHLQGVRRVLRIPEALDKVLAEATEVVDTALAE